MKPSYLILLLSLAIACKKNDSSVTVYPPRPPQGDDTPPTKNDGLFRLKTSVFSLVKVQFSGNELLGRTAVAYKDKVYFAGGLWAGAYPDNVIQVYDTATGFTMYGRLAESKANMAAGMAGNKIVFAGGNSQSVDIIDVTTGTITTSALKQPASFLTSASSCNSIYFIGGQNDNGYLKTIEIYDVALGAWKTDQIALKYARANAGAVNINDVIYIAGGQNEAGAVLPVEVYDIAADAWTYIDCPNPHPIASVVTLNDKIFISGGDGVSNNTVDIYNINTKSWTTDVLSDSRYSIAVASANNKIVFFGGKLSETNYSKFVDIYDDVNKEWSTVQLNEGTWGATAVAFSDMCMFGCLGFYGSFGNTSFGATDQYFVIKPQTHVWS